MTDALKIALGFMPGLIEAITNAIEGADLHTFEQLTEKLDDAMKIEARALITKNAARKAALDALGGGSTVT